MTKALLDKPTLAGLTFSELKALREDFIQAATYLFDELVRGDKTTSRELWIDSDPLHDRPPRRVLQITALIEVRQEKRNV